MPRWKGRSVGRTADGPIKGAQCWQQGWRTFQIRECMAKGGRTRKIFILVLRAFASNFVYKLGSAWFDGRFIYCFTRGEPVVKSCGDLLLRCS